VTVGPYRGGLDPLGQSRNEKKYIFSKSTEYQAIKGRNQSTEIYIHIMLWRIMQSGEKLCT